MPELPDVEHWRRFAARHATGHGVERVEVHDRGVLRNTSPQGLGRALSGQRVPEPERRGKWLILPFEPTPLVVHFGMTGELAWTSDRERRDRQGPERYDRVTLDLDGGDLAYRSPRKLGGLWLARRGIEDVTGRLGPDAGDLDEERFLALLEDRRGGVKAALMDQRLLAGIGNELSDEILFHAGIDPRRAVRELGDAERRALFGAVRDVVRASVRHGRIPRREGWITALRGSRDAPCPRCGGRVRADRVGGRTARWCPSCQR